MNTGGGGGGGAGLANGGNGGFRAKSVKYARREVGTASVNRDHQRRIHPSHVSKQRNLCRVRRRNCLRCSAVAGGGGGGCRLCRRGWWRWGRNLDDILSGRRWLVVRRGSGRGGRRRTAASYPGTNGANSVFCTLTRPMGPVGGGGLGRGWTGCQARGCPWGGSGGGGHVLPGHEQRSWANPAVPGTNVQGHAGGRGYAAAHPTGHDGGGGWRCGTNALDGGFGVPSDGGAGVVRYVCLSAAVAAEGAVWAALLGKAELVAAGMEVRGQRATTVGTTPAAGGGGSGYATVAGGRGGSGIVIVGVPLPKGTLISVW